MKAIWFNQINYYFKQKKLTKIVICEKEGFGIFKVGVLKSSI